MEQSTYGGGQSIDGRAGPAGVSARTLEWGRIAELVEIHPNGKWQLTPAGLRLLCRREFAWAGKSAR
jgi:hypothetical protein